MLLINGFFAFLTLALIVFISQLIGAMVLLPLPHAIWFAFGAGVQQTLRMRIAYLGAGVACVSLFCYICVSDLVTVALLDTWYGYPILIFDGLFCLNVIANSLPKSLNIRGIQQKDIRAIIGSLSGRKSTVTPPLMIKSECAKTKETNQLTDGETIELCNPAQETNLGPTLKAPAPETSAIPVNL